MKESQEYIYSFVGYKPVAAADLPGFADSSPKAYARILKSLYDMKLLNRAWDGNRQYGRYVYARPYPGEKGGRWFPYPKDLELASSKPTV